MGPPAMNAKRSFSRLVEKVRQGDLAAADDLADSFFNQAIFLAKDQLPNSPTPAADFEDLAISALKSFCIRIRDGKIEYLGDRELVGALRKIVKAKTNRLFEHHFAEKRDARKVKGAFDPAPETERCEKLEDQFTLFLDGDELIVDPEDQPAVARILESLQSELHGLFKTLLNRLDEHPRRALLMLLEQDLSNEELARRLGRSVASVERYRQLIREKLFGQ